ncbi:hypothetical protein CJF30_00010936 [Rutstroemia sp. NJR-2017a BBW]|nr:hypothetical protein CJF30_00010936 [Rutstroemia sp. NJR-2017a BBW]
MAWDASTISAVAALVVASFAFLVALAQYFVTGQLIRLCDSVVFGPLPGQGHRKWEWAQFRFRVLYTIPQISLDAKLWPDSYPHVNIHWLDIFGVSRGFHFLENKFTTQNQDLTHIIRLFLAAKLGKHLRCGQMSNGSCDRSNASIYERHHSHGLNVRNADYKLLIPRKVCVNAGRCGNHHEFESSRAWSYTSFYPQRYGGLDTIWICNTWVYFEWDSQNMVASSYLGGLQGCWEVLSWRTKENTEASR